MTTTGFIQAIRDAGNVLREFGVVTGADDVDGINVWLFFLKTQVVDEGDRAHITDVGAESIRIIEGLLDSGTPVDAIRKLGGPFAYVPTGGVLFHSADGQERPK